MELCSKICIGSIVGYKKIPYYGNPVSYIGKVISVGEKSLSVIYQNEAGRSCINIYSLEKIVQLPLTEELLNNTISFRKEEDKWISNDNIVVITKNKQGSKHKWKVEIYNENSELISLANFDYLHELQFYCYESDYKLDIKLGTVTILYEEYVKNC